jgi:MoaA/NifB/PqqE/SkfB family radical SAM enzyme
VDQPLFAFLNAAVTAAALRRAGAEARLVDAFLLGAPRRLAGGWIRLGAPVSRVLAAPALREADAAVVLFPPWARLERNLAQGLGPLLDGLPSHLRPVLADGSLGETHFVTADPAWILARLPVIAAYAEREPEGPLAAWLAGDDHPHLHRREEGQTLSGAATRSATWDLDLDRLPVEQYATLLDHGAVRDLRRGLGEDGPCFPYVASRGCPFRCTFCTGEHGRPWVGLPVDQMAADLEILARRGIREIAVLDAIANADPKRFRGLLAQAADLGLRLAFPNGLRVDRLAPEDLVLLARVTRRLKVSIETASPTSQRRLGKRLRLRAAERVLAQSQAVRLPTEVHYLAGIPGEDGGDLNRTLALAARLESELGAVPRVQPYVPPSHLRVPADQGQGLPDDAYAAFGARPVAVSGSLPVDRVQAHRDAFERRRRAAAEQKLVLNVSYRCNNRCVFCSVDQRARVDGDLAAQRQAITEAAGRGVRLLDLDGGEPTLYPHLAELVDLARRLGLERIAVTTNGRMLAYPGRAAALREAGVTDLLISLHGPDATVQDALTRSPGSFEQTLAGLRAALPAFPDLGVNTTVVAASLPHLPALARRLRDLGARRWTLQWVTPFGAATGRPDLVPDPAEAAQVLGPLLRDHADALAVQLIGLPPCEVPVAADLTLGDHEKAARTMRFVDGAEVNLGAYLAARRRHDDGCAACPSRLVCAGRWDHASAFPEDHGAGPGARPGDPPIRLLDLIPGYACNVQCDYCSQTAELRRVNLTFAEVLPLLAEGRAQGIDAVGFGGGEPTVRDDLERLIAEARRLGYRTRKVQSNGFRFAYPAYADRLVAAGMNRVHLSLMSHDAAVYARITGRPDGLALAEQAVRNLRRPGVVLAGDLIVKHDTHQDLPATLAHFHALGVTEFALWLVALLDRNRDNLGSLPPMAELRPSYLAAFEWGRRHGVPVRSRHVPACLLRGYEDHVVDLGAEDVWVVTPGASFWLLTSAVSANRLSPRCAPCTRKGRCLGLRADWLERFGDQELTPYV